MNQRKASGQTNAQSQTSQEFSNNSELSTVKNYNQVDSIDNSTIDNGVPTPNARSKNGKGNINPSANPEDLKSKIIVSAFRNSNESKSAIEKANSNPTSKNSAKLSGSSAIDTQNQLKAVDRALESLPHIYFTRAQELLECDDSESHALAVKTIRTLKKNEEASWVLTGIAAYRVWNDTPGLPGGAGNLAEPGEGRMRALEDLAAECSEKGSEVKMKTLYDYVRRIKILVEEPLSAFAGSNENTVRYERTVLIQNLFMVPGSFARAAVSTTKPLDAIEIGCQIVTENANAATLPVFRDAIRHLKKGRSPEIPEDLDQSKVTDGFSVPTTSLPTEETTGKSKPKPVRRTGGLLSLQINQAAKKAKISPKVVNELYVSLLETLLSTYQDMGVEE